MNRQLPRIVVDGHEIHSFADWQRFAQPKGKEFHWKRGRSAYECAAAWFGSGGLPAVPTELAQLLRRQEALAGARITTVLPEHKVRFDALPGEPRNADVNAIAQSAKGVVAISIEAKADESFDRPVSVVLDAAVTKIGRDQPTNAVLRVQQLAASILGRERWPRLPLGEVPYQLLTGVAGAIAFAKQQEASVALFVVHEFATDETTDERHLRNLRDLNRFVERLQRGRGIGISCGDLIGPIRYHGAPLFSERSRPELFIAKVRRVTRASDALGVFGRPYDDLALEREHIPRDADWRARFTTVASFAGGAGGQVYLADNAEGHFVVTSETMFAELLEPDEPTESVYRFESPMAREVWCAERFSRLERTEQ